MAPVRLHEAGEAQLPRVVDHRPGPAVLPAQMREP